LRKILVSEIPDFRESFDLVSLFSIIALGFFLGMRHATDPDHVIAVTTIVSRQRSIARAAWIGVFWGIGHTLTILLVGAAIILFGLVIPPRIGLSMEFSVGLMLIVLGIMNVVSFRRSISVAALQTQEELETFHSHPHSHGDYVHSRLHGHSPEEHSHALEHTPLGYLDRVFAGKGLYQYFRPLLVGIVHGLAGSAAVTLLVLTTIHNSYWAVAYLLVFGIGTIAGMMLITMSIASTFQFVGKNRGFSQRLAVVSGLLSLAFGLVVVYQIGVVNGLFTGHPHWTPR
jgi:ABC-type nickel/cobalt efflux system permease component RcnA